jgi:ClpX C4-type zinc finger
MWADTAFKRLGWASRRKLRCSFCGRDSAEVERLVAGASAYICDACVNKCVAVLEQHGGVAPITPHR